MRALLLLALILLVPRLQAQDDAPRNLVFVEAGGAAYLYSLNYAHVFRQPVVSSMMRVGVSLSPDWDRGFNVPLEYSLLAGKKRHFAEFGVAVTYFSRVISNPGEPYSGQEGATFRTQGINIAGRVGYCFFPLKRKSLVIRAAWTPIHFARSYYFDEVSFVPENLPLWGGLSIGYAF